jgi:hypothetical protein
MTQNLLFGARPGTPHRTSLPDVLASVQVRVRLSARLPTLLS